MRIKNVSLLAWLCLGVFVFSSSLPAKIKAVTVEVEEDEGEVDSAPTPVPQKNKVSKPKAAVSASDIEKEKTTAEKPKTETPKTESASAPYTPVPEKHESRMARVRISDKVGFYYFVKSGFVVPDTSKINSVGTVIGSYDRQISYSAPKKTYIEVKENVGVKPGDLLVVYHTVDRIVEPHSGFDGILARNLAIVKVLEVDKRRCLVVVKKSFFPFEDGDKVRSYEDELKRWKQAQVKKPLPDHMVTAFVASGTKGSDYLSQADFIILTVGSQDGVVEGQKFKLKEMKDLGIMADPVHLDRGIAQVFYTGTDYSMAQIHFSSLPIEKGFKAIYQP